MPFNPASPGVYQNEVNISTNVPAVATTVGAIAGIFRWGQLFTPTLVGSETQLVNLFFKPSNLNAETWFSAKNFLDYGDNLLVVRTAMTGIVVNSTVNTAPNCAVTAVSNSTASWTDVATVTAATYNVVSFQNMQEANSVPVNAGAFAAKYPGSLGNSLRVGLCVDPNQYHDVVSLVGTITSGASSGNSYTGLITVAPGSKVGNIVFTAVGGSNIAAGNLFANTLVASFANGDYFRVPTNNRLNSYQFLQATKIANAVTNTTATLLQVTFNTPYAGSANLSANSVERYWEYWKIAPPANTAGWTSAYQANSAVPTGKDLVQMVVVDEDGIITGTPNTVLEVFKNLSRATDAQNPDGTTNFYQTVINQNSQWVWVLNDQAGYVSNTANNLASSTVQSAPFNSSLTFGNDGDSEAVAPMSTLINGWTYFQDKDAIKINLVIAGKAIGSTGTAGLTNTTYNNFGMSSWLINNVVQKRQDCILLFSPDKSVVVNNTLGNDIPTDLVNWAGLVGSSDRAVMDSGYKYQYDQYSGLYRWIPLNGDIAGLCVYTDTVAYPWFSPAGLNRGQIKNVTKLAWNPSQSDRDFIYPNAINPVVTFPGQGTFLYGDRTFTLQPSAFDRINVRRMFLFIEQSIAVAARYTLFELNDVFTQNAFKNMVNPFLKAVQSARGITDFQVICDAVLNTAQVVDANQFLCAILVKPARSINFINITYYAVPDGVAFSTVQLT